MLCIDKFNGACYRIKKHSTLTKRPRCIISNAVRDDRRSKRLIYWAHVEQTWDC